MQPRHAMQNKLHKVTKHKDRWPWAKQALFAEEVNRLSGLLVAIAKQVAGPEIIVITWLRFLASIQYT